MQMEYASITQRVEAKTRDIKVSLYETLVAAVLADDGLKVIQFAQQVENVADLQDIEYLAGLVVLDKIPVKDLNEFCKSFLFGGNYDDYFIDVRKEEYQNR